MKKKDRKARVLLIVGQVAVIVGVILCGFAWFYLTSIGSKFAAPFGYAVLLVALIFFL